MKTPQYRRLEAALKLAVGLLNTPSLVTLEKGGVKAAEQIIRLANSCFPDETIFPEWNVETERLWYSDEAERITRECEAYNKLNHTSIRPYECIRIDGYDQKVMPVFDTTPERYTFMAGIVEGFPVFNGEKSVWMVNQLLYKVVAAFPIP